MRSRSSATCELFDIVKRQNRRGELPAGLRSIERRFLYSGLSGYGDQNGISQSPL